MGSYIPPDAAARIQPSGSRSRASSAASRYTPENYPSPLPTQQYDHNGYLVPHAQPQPLGTSPDWQQPPRPDHMRLSSDRHRRPSNASERSHHSHRSHRSHRSSSDARHSSDRYGRQHSPRPSHHSHRSDSEHRHSHHSHRHSHDDADHHHSHHEQHSGQNGHPLRQEHRPPATKPLKRVETRVSLGDTLFGLWDGIKSAYGGKSSKR